MFDHFISKNSTAHKVNSYCTLAISYCTFYVEKHTILGPENHHVYPGRYTWILRLHDVVGHLITLFATFNFLHVLCRN